MDVNNMASIYTIALFILITTTATLSCRDPDERPDVRLVKEIGAAFWEHREQFLYDIIEELSLTGVDTDPFFDFVEEAVAGPDTQGILTCPQCITIIGGLQGFIAAGLTFDDIRDLAVQVCKNVTVLLDYDGDIMCDGLIDNFGPHVYYVLNVTELGPREVCEFHHVCEERDFGLYKNNDKLSIKPERVQLRGDRPRKEDMIRVGHIADVHFDDKYAPGSATDCQLPVCCRDYWEGTGIANEWGDYSCAVPVQTAELMLQTMAELHPHVVMNAGDTPPHVLWEETQMGQIQYSEWLAESIQRFMPESRAYTCIGNHGDTPPSVLWEETQTGQIAYSQWFADAIQRFMPDARGYTCIGNHDVFPTNLYYGQRPQIQALNRNITEMYAPLSNWTDEAIETMEIAGYYAMEVLPGLMVMAINSNYGYTDNFYGVLLPDSPDWLAHSEYIENTFLQARETGHKIIILHHHTVGGGFTFYVEWINRMLETYGDTILFQLQGHSHQDSFQMSSDENITSTSVMFTMSTFSTAGRRNPTFRVMYLHPDTYLPLEWDQYYIDVSTAVDGETPDVQLMYNTYDDYNMTDLSLASLEEFIDRLVVDDDLYYEYHWNKATRVPGQEPGPCDTECRERMYCDMRTSSSERRQQCLDQLAI